MTPPVLVILIEQRDLESCVEKEESITSVVLDLGTNGHFGARTCGIHCTRAKTWLGRASTVQITFGYE